MTPEDDEQDEVDEQEAELNHDARRLWHKVGEQEAELNHDARIFCEKIDEQEAEINHDVRRMFRMKSTDRKQN